MEPLRWVASVAAVAATALLLRDGDSRPRESPRTARGRRRAALSPCGAPAEEPVLRSTRGGVIVDLPPPSGPCGRVVRIVRQDEWVAATVAVRAGASQVHRHLPPGVYTAQLKLVDPDGESPWSDPALPVRVPVLGVGRATITGLRVALAHARVGARRTTSAGTSGSASRRLEGRRPRRA